MTITPQQTPAWRIDDWFPALSEEVRGQLKIFFEAAQEHGRSLGLVAPKTLPFMDVLHFADCIQGSELIYKDFGGSKELVDIGIGNGFPGLVFAAMYKDVAVRIIEMDERKVEFIKKTAMSMKLKNISVTTQMIDKLPEGSLTCCVSRSWTSISKAILATRRLFKPGGQYYHFKTEGWATEVGDIPTQLCSVWTPSLVGEYKLPMGPSKFAVIKTVKIG